MQLSVVGYVVEIELLFRGFRIEMFSELGVNFYPVEASAREVVLKPACVDYSRYRVERNGEVLGEIHPHMIDNWLIHNSQEPRFHPDYPKVNFMVYGYRGVGCEFLFSFDHWHGQPRDASRYADYFNTYWIYVNSSWAEDHQHYCYDRKGRISRFLIGHEQVELEEINIQYPKDLYFVYNETTGKCMPMSSVHLNQFLEKKDSILRVVESSGGGGGSFGDDDDDW